jgi:hypothetical protein
MTVQLTDRFGLFGLTELKGENFSPPEDADRFWQLRRVNSVGRIGEEDGAFAVVEYGDDRFRMRRDKLVDIPASRIKFVIGDAASTGERVGTVFDVAWHYKRDEPYYLLRFGGRRSSRWHFNDELQDVESPDGMRPSAVPEMDG